MATKRTKPSKKTATSKGGTKYQRSAKSETGWVEVKSYTRAKAKRDGGPKSKEARFCRDTRKARTKNRKPLKKK